MGDDMNKRMSDFNKAFDDSSEKLIKDMEKTHTQAMVQAIATSNLILTMALLYKGPLNRHEGSVKALISGFLDPTHEAITNGIVGGVDDQEELSNLLTILGGEGDDLITKVRDTLNKSFEKTKEGLFEGFTKTCAMFDKLDAQEKAAKGDTSTTEGTGEDRIP